MVGHAAAPGPGTAGVQECRSAGENIETAVYCENNTHSHARNKKRKEKNESAVSVGSGVSPPSEIIEKTDKSFKVLLNEVYPSMF